jgi:Flp pilus assembly pilin Flp
LEDVLREVRRSESGQAVVDYSLIVAVVAIGCILGILFLTGAIRGLFESNGSQIGPAPLQPPVASPLTWPSSLADCEHGGWRNYPQFESESECADYVASLTP